mmetsp:Transcript_86095/g.244197  ORF Transcript_86095/g.244197 Transcript_86095/m.244197 type:complete len:363 (+) Transcript_86095:267-1355(+)
MNSLCGARPGSPPLRHHQPPASRTCRCSRWDVQRATSRSSIASEHRVRATFVMHHRASGAAQSPESAVSPQGLMRRPRARTTSRRHHLSVRWEGRRRLGPAGSPGLPPPCCHRMGSAQGLVHPSHGLLLRLARLEAGPHFPLLQYSLERAQSLHPPPFPAVHPLLPTQSHFPRHLQWPVPCRPKAQIPACVPARVCDERPNHLLGPRLRARLVSVWYWRPVGMQWASPRGRLGKRVPEVVWLQREVGTPILRAPSCWKADCVPRLGAVHALLPHRCPAPACTCAARCHNLTKVWCLRPTLVGLLQRLPSSPLHGLARGAAPGRGKMMPPTPLRARGSRTGVFLVVGSRQLRRCCRPPACCTQ